MESLVRRRIRRGENRQDIGETEVRDFGKKRQSSRERTEDGTRTEKLQEVEKQKHTKLVIGEETGRQSGGMMMRGGDGGGWGG